MSNVRTEFLLMCRRRHDGIGLFRPSLGVVLLVLGPLLPLWGDQDTSVGKSASFSIPWPAVARVSQVKSRLAETAHEAMDRFMTAFVRGDEPTVQGVIAAKDRKTRLALAEICAFNRELRLFRDAVQSKYGKDAWEKLNAPGSGGLTLRITEAKRVTEQDVVVRGDSAQFQQGGGGVELGRTADGWLVQAESFAGSGRFRQQANVTFALALTLRQIRTTLPQAKITLTALDELSGDAMLQAQMAASALPPGVELHFPAEPLIITVSSVVAQPEPTAHQAAERLLDALVAGKESRVQSLTSAESPLQRQVLAGLCRLAREVITFRTALEKKYGPGAWEKLATADNGGFSFSFVDRRHITPEEVTIDGDRAEVRAGAGQVPLRLVRRDGGWLVDASCLVTGDAERSKNSLGALVGVLWYFRSEMADQDASLEDLDHKMGAVLTALSARVSQPIDLAASGND